MREWLTNKKYTEEYKEYMHSETWGARRLAAFEYYGRICQACGKSKSLHVHHADYTHFKNEPFDDLRIICKRCHTDLHKKFDRSKITSLRDFTDQYIREKGKPLKKKHQNRLFLKGKPVDKKKPRLSTVTSCVDDEYLLPY